MSVAKPRPTLPAIVPAAASGDELVHQLREQLERERARNAGLEQGLAALSERVEELRAENRELRRLLALRDG